MNEHQQQKLAQAKNHAHEKGGICLSSNYVNNYTKLEWKCADPRHSTWKQTFSIVCTRNHWCIECAQISKSKTLIHANGLDRARQHAVSKGGLCLSTNYVKQTDILEWKCHDLNHASWNASAKRVLNGTWCPYCKADATAKRQYNSSALSTAKTHALSKGGACLSDIYLNSTTKLLWQCGNVYHKTWSSSYRNVVVVGHWCPECGKSNLSEKRTRLIFESFFGVGFPATRAKWNVNVWTGLPLELDGYCKEFNVAFEHDGEHHEQVVSYHGTKRLTKSDLIYQKFKDEQKKKNCQKQGITLLIIPIAEKGIRNNFEPFLENVEQACSKQGLLITFNEQQLVKLKRDFYSIQ